MHPELIAWKTKATSGVDEEGPLALGSIEGVPHPHLRLTNRFEALSPDIDRASDWGIASLDVVEDEVNSVSREINKISPRKEQLKPAGKGKITIDSGAAESVLPKDMLPGEALLEGSGKKAGVKYMAACGTSMANHGEKTVRFRSPSTSGSGTIASIKFQVTDVNKPLASVSRILDQGNTVVFSRTSGGSYIMNDASGARIPVEEERGVFVMPVEFLEPVAGGAAPFVRRGS